MLCYVVLLYQIWTRYCSVVLVTTWHIPHEDRLMYQSPHRGLYVSYNNHNRPCHTLGWRHKKYLSWRINQTFILRLCFQTSLACDNVVHSNDINLYSRNKREEPIFDVRQGLYLSVVIRKQLCSLYWRVLIYIFAKIKKDVF